MADPYPDFYSSLKALLDQVPDGRATSPLRLASAMGDPIAEKAIEEALKREAFLSYLDRVVPEPYSGREIFSEFKGEKLLEKLARRQEERKIRAVITPLISEVRLIAGVDASYKDDTAYAACVIMDEELGVVESASAAVQVRFPYIPGYLAFRETPGLITVLGMASDFDVLMVNGHGVAHPRGCGLASWMGVEVDKPTIGVARRPLKGCEEKIRGVLTTLIFNGSKVEAEKRAPIYVSAGHRIDLEDAVRITEKTLAGGRLPKPLREAHNIAVAASRRRG